PRRGVDAGRAVRRAAARPPGGAAHRRADPLRRRRPERARPAGARRRSRPRRAVALPVRTRGRQALHPHLMRLVVFDFDGLILDTEVPVYDAWQAIYAEHGHTLEFDKWAACIGTADVFDPGQELASLCGRALDTTALKARHRVDCDALIATESVRPGVRDYVAEARRLGLRL